MSAFEQLSYAALGAVLTEQDYYKPMQGGHLPEPVPSQPVGLFGTRAVTTWIMKSAMAIALKLERWVA